MASVDMALNLYTCQGNMSMNVDITSMGLPLSQQIIVCEVPALNVFVSYEHRNA